MECVSFLASDKRGILINVFEVSALKFRTLFHSFLAEIFLFVQLFPKIPSGMAKSRDPDQTAPLGYATLSDT